MILGTSVVEIGLIAVSVVFLAVAWRLGARTRRAREAREWPLAAAYGLTTLLALALSLRACTLSQQIVPGGTVQPLIPRTGGSSSSAR